MHTKFSGYGSQHHLLVTSFCCLKNLYGSLSVASAKGFLPPPLYCFRFPPLSVFSFSLSEFCIYWWRFCLSILYFATTTGIDDIRVSSRSTAFNFWQSKTSLSLCRHCSCVCRLKIRMHNVVVSVIQGMGY